MKMTLPMRNHPYLLIVTNLFCNFKCSYCIQKQASLDVRMNPNKVDVDAVLAFLKRNRIASSAKVLGGEATVHPDFDKLVDGLLQLYRRVYITTNLNGKWYRDFDETIEKMRRWGRAIKWNTTFHPGFMEVDLYIERIRKIREAGLRLDQVASTDTDDLTTEIADKLVKADINWKLQTFTGRGKDGRLLPQSWDDVRSGYPLLYDPSKYIEKYDLYAGECEDANFDANFTRPEWISCTTSNFLIGPDNKIYPCHRHLYAEDEKYMCGSIYDLEMKGFRRHWQPWRRQWVLPCNMKCSPCDFGSVKIQPVRR